MKPDHTELLVCPKCKGNLEPVEAKTKGDSIESGKLKCSPCELMFPILRHIPRFVPFENYASNFGFEWTKHALTQYDSYSGSNVSEKRFFEETKWPRDMSGQFVLEVGSGSGRFTEQVASTKAMVVSVDYSYAVEANYASNGHRDNVLVVQGDIYNLPLREGFFDKLFCFGVLQHTPDVERAFLALPAYLKSGGHIAVDFYRKFPWYMRMFQTKYFVLPLTRRIKPEHLYRMTNRYVECMWPISRVIHKMPYGKKLNWLLLVADYRGVYNLSEDMLKEWAILDVFDMLSPAYDQPQTLDDVQHLLTNAKLKDTDVHYGYNGIEARGVRL